MRLSELFLTEAREGYLYHATTHENAAKILSDNTILGKTFQELPFKVSKKAAFKSGSWPGPGGARGISLTRDIRFAVQWASGFGDKWVTGEILAGVILTLNQGLLHRDVGKRLQPIDYFQITDLSGPMHDNLIASGIPKPKRRQGKYAEAEEFLIGDLTNLNKYLIGFTLVTTLSTAEELSTYLPEPRWKVLLKDPDLSLYNPLTKKLSKMVMNEYVDDIQPQHLRLW